MLTYSNMQLTTAEGDRSYGCRATSGQLHLHGREKHLLEHGLRNIQITISEEDRNHECESLPT